MTTNAPLVPPVGRRLLIIPDGWPCRFADCPPGLFVIGDAVCFKTEYGQDAYNEAGEAFWGGVDTNEKRAELIVQPCIAEWRKDDD